MADEKNNDEKSAGNKDNDEKKSGENNDKEKNGVEKDNDSKTADQKSSNEKISDEKKIEEKNIEEKSKDEIIDDKEDEPFITINITAEQASAYIKRLWNIHVDVEKEWEEIYKDSIDYKDFYIKYIIPLAAIGPIASFIGFGYVGIPGYRTLPLLYCFLQSSISFIFMLLSVYMMAVLISSVTYVTGNYDDDSEAIKVAAYSYTPNWLASLLYLNPIFTPVIIVLSFYGLVIAYFGFRKGMKSPPWLAGWATVIIAIFGLAFGMTPYFLTKDLYQIYIGTLHVQSEQVSEPISKPPITQSIPQNRSTVIVPGIDTNKDNPSEAEPPLKRR